MKKLTNKQAAFVKEYLIDFNGTQAAIRAGYTAKNAGVRASKLLTKDNIQKEIARLMEERNKRLDADADYVLKRLIQIDQMDLKDVLNDNGALKVVSDWPEIWRQFVTGYDVSEIYDGRGKDRQLSGLLKKIKWPDKVRNLELIGKHVNVQAFKEQVGVTGELEIVQSIKDIIREGDGKSFDIPSRVNND